MSSNCDSFELSTYATGAIAAVVAVIVLLFQKASPESLGYASVNAPKQSSGVSYLLLWLIPSWVGA